jgi:CBS domain-containing protein
MATMKNILESKGFTFYYVAPNTKVLEALKMLTEKRIGVVLVMDGERLWGVFSERDFVRLAVKTGSFSPDLAVSEVMTSQVFYVKLDTTVDECMALMTEKRIRHVPVMDGKMVVGLVSIGDVVKELVAERESVIRGLENFIAVREFPT